MRHILSIVFLGCFIVLAFNKAFVLLNFYIHQDAITVKFCVNKNRPKMHCNGKCYLAKQIKEQEQREAGQAVMELAKIEVISSRSFFAEVSIPIIQVKSLNYTLFKQQQLLIPHLSSVFRPPTA